METRNSPGTGERIPVVAVDMEEAERIGLIKIDALGLKTLSVISNTLEIIKQRINKDIDLLSIDLKIPIFMKCFQADLHKGCVPV
jgi:DNA polymerase III alpha subunit